MKITFIILFIALASLTGCTQQIANPSTELNQSSGIKYNPLTPGEESVIIHKNTERAFTGKYDNFFEDGTYNCKRCNTPLYKSSDKFNAGCGWPSFDDEIPSAVKRIPDADGMRTEIVCAHCGAHLGHVFDGEGFTPQNTRHCVNSVSLSFIPAVAPKAEADTAVFAGGCFWGVEYYMQKAKGVISTEVGYIGGHGTKPTYQEVCSHTTGYAEAVRVVFNPAETTFENIARLFFEIHDPTQMNRQGPDIGDQYRSAVFYHNDEQKLIAEKLIGILKSKGYKVTTQIVHATKFWKAEEFHQQYYEKENGTPYCHGYVKRF